MKHWLHVMSRRQYVKFDVDRRFDTVTEEFVFLVTNDKLQYSPQQPRRLYVVKIAPLQLQGMRDAAVRYLFAILTLIPKSTFIALYKITSKRDIFGRFFLD